MLSVAEATAIVLDRARPLPPMRVPLEVALGCVLAEDVVSDLDMPPFDKAMMDGFAVRSADVPGTLAIVEEIAAGRVPTQPLGPGHASRIATGAAIPTGADAVVMIERCEVLDGGRSVRLDDAAAPGQNIQPRGRELRRDETVLRGGARLRPQEIGLLAIVGRDPVCVVPQPEVAILSTGDELTPPRDRPAPGRIRNSNGPMLAAQIARAGGRPRSLGIARDQFDELRQRISDGLRSPILVLSGGVSAGHRDLVPDVLDSLGVEPCFHKVALKPGKPVFFGVRRGDDFDRLVFGLPGNPVSAFVAFELFVRPVMATLSGLTAQPPRFEPRRLASDFQFTTDRPTYHPARATRDEVQPVEWRGSPDLRALTLGNALVLLPPGTHEFHAGDLLPVMTCE